MQRFVKPSSLNIVIADGNFPCYGVNNNVVRADGLGTVELLKVILQLIPLDTYAQWNVAFMEVVKGGDNYKPEILDTTSI